MLMLNGNVLRVNRDSLLTDTLKYLKQKKHSFLNLLKVKKYRIEIRVEMSDIAFYLYNDENVSCIGGVHRGEWNRLEGLIGRILLPPFQVSSQMGEKGAGGP